MRRFRRKAEREINPREKALMLLTIISIVVAALSLSQQRVGARELIVGNADIKDLSTEGFVQVRLQAGVNGTRGVLAMQSGCYRLVAGTDVAQAESIKAALEGESGPRPNSHELMRDVFKHLGVDVVMVKVTELRGNNFIGRTILKQGDVLLNLDSKPSDGAALALRTGAPIYFNETLMKEMGEKIC
jgi:bifunctional DNase/RNase